MKTQHFLDEVYLEEKVLLRERFQTWRRRPIAHINWLAEVQGTNIAKSTYTRWNNRVYLIQQVLQPLFLVDRLRQNRAKNSSTNLPEILWTT